jgi:hypothetical protein
MQIHLKSQYSDKPLRAVFRYILNGDVQIHLKWQYSDTY